MTRFAKIALGGLMAGGIALAAATPAAARVSVGIGFGVPGYYAPYYDPCDSPRFRYWHPYRCGTPVYYERPYYDEWYGGPSFYLYSGGGHHWHHGGWHDEGRHEGWHHHH